LIFHDHKAVFVHIPKCGGTSIEKLWFPDMIVSQLSDYQKFVGWHEHLLIWMQHATMSEILQHYNEPEDIESYFSFTFVRNPWERALSDWHWMNKNLTSQQPFEDYLNVVGDFRASCYSSDQTYRGDHFKTQSEFTHHHGERLVDFIGRFENIDEDFATILSILSLPPLVLPHYNKSSYPRPYWQNYTDKQRDLVSEIFAEDIYLFGYKFKS